MELSRSLKILLGVAAITWLFVGWYASRVLASGYELLVSFQPPGGSVSSSASSVVYSPWVREVIFSIVAAHLSGIALLLANRPAGATLSYVLVPLSFAAYEALVHEYGLIGTPISLGFPLLAVGTAVLAWFSVHRSAVQ
jgi:hypothetical protein